MSRNMGASGTTDKQTLDHRHNRLFRLHHLHLERSDKHLVAPLHRSVLPWNRHRTKVSHSTRVCGGMCPRQSQRSDGHDVAGE